MPTGQRTAVDHRFLKLWRRCTALVYHRRAEGNQTLTVAHSSLLPHDKVTDIVSLTDNRSRSIGRLLYGMSLGSIVLCITLWIRAKTIGEDERGNAERRALFVGLWPPMFWLIGDTIGGQRRGRARRRAPNWLRIGRTRFRPDS
jgi:hypothetical protein